MASTPATLRTKSVIAQRAPPSGNPTSASTRPPVAALSVPTERATKATKMR